jgi:hypothetical protein
MSAKTGDRIPALLKHLRRTLQSGTAEAVADSLVIAFRDYGVEFLGQVRQHKILFRIYSIERGNTISEALQLRLNAALQDQSLTVQEARDVTRFLNEHRVFVTPKIHLHDFLDRLPCWQIERNVALMELAAEIESQLRYEDDVVRSRLEAVQLPAVVGSQTLGARCRHVLEDGKIVLRELLRRNPHHTVSAGGHGCRWDQVLNSADRWRQIEKIEDRYAYFGHSLFISSSSDFDLVVCRPRSSELEGALHFADYRSAHYDLAALETAQPEGDHSETALGAQVHATMGGGIDFARLMDRMEPEVERYVAKQIDGRRQIIDQSHMAVLLQSDQCANVFGPVLEAWNCLFRLSVLRRLVLDKLAQEKALCVGVLTFVLGRHRLSQYLRDFGKLDESHSSAVLHLLSFDPDCDPIEEYDPYLRPLVRLDSERLLVLDPYIYAGRFARNALKALAQDGRVDLDECGRALERQFQRILGDAAFSTNDGRCVIIRDQEGRPLTDLDVVAYRDGVLFLGQAKAVIPPGSAYEIYRMIGQMKEAAVQLRLSVNNIDANIDTVKQTLGIPENEPLRIKALLPYILCNDITLTGYRLDGFMVLDPILLSETLEMLSPHNLTESLRDELESTSRMHEHFADRMVYHEVDVGSTVFLTFGTTAFPLTC